MEWTQVLVGALLLGLLLWLLVRAGRVRRQYEESRLREPDDPRDLPPRD